MQTKLIEKHYKAKMAQFFNLSNNSLVYGSSVALVVVFLYGVRKYRSRSWGKCTNSARLDGKTVLITGANSGLGYETAKELSARGAQIILACRDKSLALNAIKRIQAQQANKVQSPGKLIFMEVDLASLQSITKFCSSVAKKYEKIDILVNNAGLSVPVSTKSKQLTQDGLEIHFGVNYLSHFVLTNLLLPLLHNPHAHPRVINVSSLLHEKGFVNLSDINYEQHPPRSPYADSKLQQIYFGQELAGRNSGKLNVYNLCPGWVYTNLFRHSIRNIFKLLFAVPVALLFMRSANQGAQSIIYCATEPNLEDESGMLYRDCHKITSKFNFTAIERKQLWDVTVDLVESMGVKLTLDPGTSNAEN